MMWPGCKDPEKCQHWQDWVSLKDVEYDWCHVCVMEHDCFKPVEEKGTEQWATDTTCTQ